ncbi:MAG TPA: DUF1275 domain-containing protein [Clostridium sp.]|nr:DUF1275 domain-containing protein [Clostridium sp.]
MITKDLNNNNTTSSNSNTNMITAESLRLGVFLAATGGFLDAYTFICRGGVFANAETGNMVLLAIGVATGDIHRVFTALLPILSFMLGVFIYSKITSYRPPSIAFIKGHEIVILIIEILVLIIVGFIPSTVDNIFVTTTISFVSSVQMCTFRKLSNCAYNTTMCTGNLRSACETAYRALTTNNKEEAKKSIRYFTIILCFIIGSAIGGYLTIAIGVKSIWFAALILIFAVCLFTYDEIKYNRM